MLARNIRIISLGEITSPNDAKAIGAFIRLIAAKNNGLTAQQIQANLVKIMQTQTHLLINDFKLGLLSKEDFADAMIHLIHGKTQVTLTRDEFYNAWNEKNPKLSEFQSLLDQLIEFNNQPGNQVVIISLTNQLDMEHFLDQLQTNEKYSFATTQNRRLIDSICRMKMHCSYQTGLTKDLLISYAIANVMRSSLAQPSFTATIGSASKEAENNKTLLYVRSGIKHPDPVVQQAQESTNADVKAAADRNNVDTITWDKSQPLSEALTSTKASVRVALAAL